MLYDKALDDGPMVVDVPPCLTIVTNSCEDKNDKISVCDDNLIHESPILFLSSPIYTIEEKYALCKKYMHGLKLSYWNPTCNHDVNDDINSCNYFERGKHVNECHDNFNDPLYVSKVSKLYALNGYIVKFASSDCNYYERGGDKCHLYVINNYKLHLSTENMQWNSSIFCDLFIYKMPMHRKKLNFVVICSMFCVALCHVLVWLLLLLMWAHLGILVFGDE